MGRAGTVRSGIVAGMRPDLGRRLHRTVPLVLPAALLAGSLPAVPAAAAAAPICHSRAHPYIAKKLSGDILTTLRARRSYAAISVYDRKRHITCQWRQRRHFDSASIVKVTILAAYLRKTHGELSKADHSLAWKMITRSDNNAATALWNKTGRAAMVRFLRAAGMTATHLDPAGHWGLTQVTAGNELKLLKLLTHDNKVVSHHSRTYVLSLMRRVVKSQRWGTPAGTPAHVTVHVKNGWLPRATHGWRIHSLGTFAGSGHNYMMAVLTQDNPSMSYGVGTVERAARVVHRDLNPGQKPSIKLTRPAPSWGTSDGSAPFQVRVG